MIVTVCQPVRLRRTSVGQLALRRRRRTGAGLTIAHLVTIVILFKLELEVIG